MKYTDNVRFNNKLNLWILISAAIVFAALDVKLDESLVRASLFTFIYAFASAFIQPDLDQSVQRPGKETFPLGRLKSTKIGEKIFPLFYPLNIAWYYFWQTYGYLWTHRGLSHWPVIGTWTRAGYVFCALWLAQRVVARPEITFAMDWVRLFFPITKQGINWELITVSWINSILPFFVADTLHFIVDMGDSIRNNTSFASYAHDPGILKKIFNPAIMKYHKRALKKAKSNNRKRK